MKLTWFGHDTFLISAKNINIYIDPFQLPNGAQKADMILLTHTHFDHTSSEDIDKIKKASTQFVTTADSEITENLHIMKPGDKEKIGEVSIDAVPAYNVNKNFHTKDKNWNGYIIALEGKRIYHTGDTDLIPEMGKIRCDVSLLPVSGTYVMTAEEAVEAAKRIKPKMAIPMHYGSIVGSDSDATTFKEKAEKAGINVTVLKKNGSVEI